MPISSLPDEKGSYLLILRLPGPKQISVGRRGRIGFERGWYAYSGSAFGTGGLAARLKHHLKPALKPHWHIDYLRAEAMVVEVWMAMGLPRREHDWASTLVGGPQSGAWVPGFGCSDCRCVSHLLHFNRRPGNGFIRQKLGPDIIWLQLAPDLVGP